MPATGPPSGGFDLASFARRHGGVTKYALGRGSRLFSQGEPANEMFYLDHGQIQLSVTSVRGRRAIVGILTSGDFCGESCLAGKPKQLATAMCVADSVVARIAQPIVIRAVQQDPGFAAFCVTYFLERSARLTERLISQFFDSGENRLARILLQLSNHGSESGSTVIRNLDQEALAQLIGTSRSRTNYFMNKFRDLGHIRYDGYNYIIVHGSLSQILSRESRGETPEGLNNRSDRHATS